MKNLQKTYNKHLANILDEIIKKRQIPESKIHSITSLFPQECPLKKTLGSCGAVGGPHTHTSSSKL